MCGVELRCHNLDVVKEPDTIPVRTAGFIIGKSDDMGTEDRIALAQNDHEEGVEVPIEGFLLLKVVLHLLLE